MNIVEQYENDIKLIEMRFKILESMYNDLSDKFDEYFTDEFNEELKELCIKYVYSLENADIFNLYLYYFDEDSFHSDYKILEEKERLAKYINDNTKTISISEKYLK